MNGIFKQKQANSACKFRLSLTKQPSDEKKPSTSFTVTLSFRKFSEISVSEMLKLIFNLRFPLGKINFCRLCDALRCSSSIEVNGIN